MWQFLPLILGPVFLGQLVALPILQRRLGAAVFSMAVSPPKWSKFMWLLWGVSLLFVMLFPTPLLTRATGLSADWLHRLRYLSLWVVFALYLHAFQEQTIAFYPAGVLYQRVFYAWDEVAAYVWQRDTSPNVDLYLTPRQLWRSQGQPLKITMPAASESTAQALLDQHFPAETRPSPI